MFNLFLNPYGELRRQDFWIAIGCFTLLIIALERVMTLLGTTMTTFWVGLIVFPVLIYSFYQVCKKRLKSMGYTARVFWMFFFLMLFLWIGMFIYFGVGEHFTQLFDYQEQFQNGQITEPQMLDLIKEREQILSEKLNTAKKPTNILLTLPAAVFLIWLAAAPARSTSES